jgi:hypothetical protein
MEPEQQLLVHAAGTAERRARTKAAAAQVAAVADWEMVTELLETSRLLPTLGPRLLEIGGARAGWALEPKLSAALEAARRKDALLVLVGEQARGALTAAGIRSTTLKGPLLGERIYGEPGRRLSGDIDLLVAPGRLDAAVAAVRELGYLAPDDEVGPDGLPLLHFSLLHGRDQLPPVELHWRIHWYETAFSAERLLPPADAPADWHPALADELASLLLFYARDGFSGLRQAADLGAWWDRFGAELPADGLERVALAYPALRPALSAAVVVAGRTVGLPQDLLARPLEGLGRRGRIAVRLADPRPYASREQLFAEVGLVDGLLAPRGGLAAFFRRQVAPPTGVIREHAEKAGASHGPGSSLGYAARMVTRYLFALGRLARIPGAERLRFGREAAA